MRPTMEKKRLHLFCVAGTISFLKIRKKSKENPLFSPVRQKKISYYTRNLVYYTQKVRPEERENDRKKEKERKTRIDENEEMIIIFSTYS